MTEELTIEDLTQDKIRSLLNELLMLWALWRVVDPSPLALQCEYNECLSKFEGKKVNIAQVSNAMLADGVSAEVIAGWIKKKGLATLFRME